jgi:1-acyl-sn-glycerol-3-phosphate acyltransferase
LSNKPPVRLDEHFKELYEFYEHHQQPRFMARIVYLLLAAQLRPHVSYAEGAKGSIKKLVQQKTPILLALNHIDDKRDAKVTSAAAFLSPIRPLLGRLRVLAKDGLFDEENAANDPDFDPKLRDKIDLMGSIPVFRQIDHPDNPFVSKAGIAMIQTATNRVVSGDSLAVYVEGTCNKTDDKTKLQHVEGGLSHIYNRARKLGKRAAIVSVGINYGPTNDASKASIFFNTPMLDLPDKPHDITAAIAEDLQVAVHGAAKYYGS